MFLFDSLCCYLRATDAEVVTPLDYHLHHHQELNKLHISLMMKSINIMFYLFISNMLFLYKLIMCIPYLLDLKHFFYE